MTEHQKKQFRDCVKAAKLARRLHRIKESWARIQGRDEV